MEEYHSKQLIVAQNMEEAVASLQNSEFWKSYHSAHVDNQFQLDIDDIYVVEDLLADGIRSNYKIQIQQDLQLDWKEDELHIGYLPILEAKLMLDQ